MLIKIMIIGEFYYNYSLNNIFIYIMYNTEGAHQSTLINQSPFTRYSSNVFRL